MSILVLLLLLSLVAASANGNSAIDAHYVWINRTNVHTTVLPDYLQHMFHSIHKMFNDTLHVHIHYYDDISKQLMKYDRELAFYFLHINPALPALLSDIGRIITLYNYGGFYHDTKMCMENAKAIRSLTHFCDLGVDVVFQEQSPTFMHVRNTNILACKKKAPIFHTILQTQKHRLAALMHMPEKQRPQSNVSVYEVGTYSVRDTLKQSSCYAHNVPHSSHYTVCRHNDTANVIAYWKLKDFHTKTLYNEHYSLHWSRSHVPLFVGLSGNESATTF